MSKELIEKLRKISKEELSRISNISEHQAQNLKCALVYFSTITDHELSIKEMAEKTGLGKGTINVYRGTLIKAGLETRKKYKYSSPESDKVLSFIKGKPSTYEEIGEKAGKTITQVANLMTFLKKKHKARNVNVELSRRNVKRNFRSDQLIDGLTDRAIAYLPGEEKLLGEKVTEYIPEKLTLGMRKSLTPRLKRILPKEAFEVVYEYICEHAVRV